MAVIDVTLDNWTELKSKGPHGLYREITPSISSETIENPILVEEDNVGFNDPVDYMSFTLASAANLSFNVSATDAAKFTIYSLVEKTDRNGNTTYSLKALQSSTLKKQKDGTYSIDTKSLLLDDDQTYYIGVQSTNAAKGGYAGYTITLNDSKFYPQDDNDDDDDWSDLKTSRSGSKVGEIGEI
jgi:hypothetical protein